MLGIDNSMGGIFQPINAGIGGMSGVGVPDMTVSPVPSSNMGASPGQGNNGIPKPPPPQQQANPLQSVQQLAGLGATGAGLYNAASKVSMPSWLSTLWNGSSPIADASMVGEPSGLGGLSGMLSGAGSSLSDGLGSILSSIGGFFGSGAAADAGASAAVDAAPLLLALKDGGAIDGYAGGGNIETAPWFARREATMPYHSTAIFNPGAGAGRTDNISANVPSGAYVVPADVVSGLGEGNTMMGANVVQRMMGSGPHGTPLPVIHHGAGSPKPPGIMKPMHFAKGGSPDGTVPIVAAGGEMMISPQDIVRKFGSLDRGHKVLDKWVVLKRKEHIDTLKKLPGPKKN